MIEHGGQTPQRGNKAVHYLQGDALNSNHEAREQKQEYEVQGEVGEHAPPVNCHHR
jgi:hypothetical protein